MGGEDAEQVPIPPINKVIQDVNHPNCVDVIPELCGGGLSVTQVNLNRGEGTI